MVTKNDVIVTGFVDRILKETRNQISRSSMRIARNIEARVPFLVENFADSECIAVGEFGPRYSVVDSGDYDVVEKRMALRVSSLGDLTGISYEIFKMKDLRGVR